MNKHIIFSLLFGAALVCSATVVQAQNTESYESLMRKGNFWNDRLCLCAGTVVEN